MTPALERPRIDVPLATGIRVIDSLLTCGKGQRLGIFSGSGVGKSTLLGQMAKTSSADVNVIILVGERGREVREFLERDLGEEGLRRSVVVVATSDEPALIRLKAAFLGTAIAEYFRDTRRDVLLMMDSVTRVALAQREIGLASGEPPATRGYPPSVFALLPKLLERSGRTVSGSITGFYNVLVEADDANEPISDTVRGTLDGHIMLSRKLAHQAHWPAIDPLASISRSMNDIVSREHRAAADSIKQLLAAYQQSEDLITIGAYQMGSNQLVDQAIKLREPIDAFLPRPPPSGLRSRRPSADLMKLARLRAGLTHVRRSLALRCQDRAAPSCRPSGHIRRPMPKPQPRREVNRERFRFPAAIAARISTASPRSLPPTPGASAGRRGESVGGEADRSGFARASICRDSRVESARASRGRRGHLSPVSQRTNLAASATDRGKTPPGRAAVAALPRCTHQGRYGGQSSGAAGRTAAQEFAYHAERHNQFEREDAWMARRLQEAAR